MVKHRNDKLQGTLALLVLQTLAARGPLHGYAITAAIERSSANLLQVEEGSLYPALHRMEQQRWLKGKWGITDKNREARFYEITRAGRAQLARERQTWDRLTEGVQRVLRYA
jgi:PadR family transcriptional regulator PadR